MAVIHLPQPDTVHRRGVSTTLGLLRLEARRNIGLVCFPLLVVFGFWLARTYLPVGIALWSSIGNATRQTLMILGPLMAGVAAWMAGRNERRRMNELLDTTPYPAATRDLTTWGATSLWGALAYLTIAAILAAITVPTATWFALPPVLRLAEGLLALIACTTIGYVTGSFIHSRFSAPFIALTLYVVQLGPLYFYSSVRYLSPIPFDASLRSVFFRVALSFLAARAGWFGGLAALGILAIVLKRRRTPVAWSMLGLVSFLTVTSVVKLLHTAPNAEEAHMAAYTPVCHQGQVVEICVHPAYQTMLPDVVPIIDKVAAPLEGVPGMPTRAEQYPLFTTTFPQGVMPFALVDRRDTQETIARQVAEGLAKDWSATWQRNGDKPVYPLDDPSEQAQAVVGDWLYAQAGYPFQVQLEDGVSHQMYQFSNDSTHPQAQAAYQRFTALNPAVRRAWLQTHLADLRAGKLTLEDLP